MPDRIKPHLCGGVFFTLLVEASKERIAPRKGITGVHGDTKDHLIMKALVDLFAEGYVTFVQDDFSGSVSKYKNCASNYGKSMPFHKEDYLLYAKDKIAEDTDRALYLMTKLLRDFFITKPVEGVRPIDQMAKKILYVVKEDEDILMDDILYCGDKCKPTRKRDLIRTESIDIQPFLLGVWNYVLQERPDNKTSACKETLKLIYKEKANVNDTGEYDDRFAKGSFPRLKINYPSFPEVPAKTIVTHMLELDEDVEDETIPLLDGEVVDERFSSKDIHHTNDSALGSKYGTFINKGVFIDTINGDFTFKK